MTVAEPRTGPVLEARRLSHAFTASGRAVPVLRGVSLTVERGEMVAVVGPSGSGKSTLLYCLSGLLSPSGGEVVLAGVALGRVGRRGSARTRRQHVGFVFQAYNLLDSLTVAENVDLPLRLGGVRRWRRGQLTAAALAEVGLADRADDRPGDLSGGQQQRVAVARALASQPDLVFADEPTGALDTATGRRVLSLLRELAAGDRSVVMVTHDIAAAALADRVVVLRDGVVAAELRRPTPSQVLTALDPTQVSV